MAPASLQQLAARRGLPNLAKALGKIYSSQCGKQQHG